MRQHCLNWPVGGRLRPGRATRLSVYTLSGLLLSLGCENSSVAAPGCPSASFEPARQTDLGWPRIEKGRSGDFDGDGKLDLAIRYEGVLYMLLGRGDGFFHPPKPILTQGASLLDLGDFNGDGRCDVNVVENGQSPSIFSLLLARADGGFDRQVLDQPLPEGLAADFNGDGQDDLAGRLIVDGMYRNNVAVSLSQGNGTFAPAVEYTIGIPVPNVRVKTGDVDGDGDLDLIRISDAGDGTVIGGTVLWAYTNTVSVLMNNGDGAFQTGPSQYAGMWIMDTAAVADFNGDGKADLACSHHYDFDPGIPQESLAILLGNGDGTFGPPALSDTGYRVWFIFTGDFNGDGAVDLGTRFSAGGVRLLLGRGDGTFQLPGSYIDIVGHAEWRHSSQIVGDFNGDGQLDFATETNSGVQVLLNACQPPSEPPNGLWIQTRNQTAVLSWPLDPSGSLLESTMDPALTDWSAVTGNFTTNQNRFELETPMDAPQRYFRLREPGR